MADSQPTFDVLIVGGGVIGLCAAWYVQQAGYSVAVVERGEIGSGSSAENAGLIVPSHFIPLATPSAIRDGLKWMLNPDSPFYIKPRANLALVRWLWQFMRAATNTHVERSMPLLLDMHLQSLAQFEHLASEADFAFGFKKNGILLLHRSDEGEHECRALVKAAERLDLPAAMLDADEVAAKLPDLELTIGGGTWLPLDAHLNPQLLLDTPT